VINNTNLTLLVIWFFVWFVIVFNGIALHGFWIPVPDPRSPSLLLMSLFFYGPPCVVIASEILKRRNGERENRATRALAISSKSFVVALGLFTLVIAGYSVSTI
jgi:hypothetical protein